MTLSRAARRSLPLSRSRERARGEGRSDRVQARPQTAALGPPFLFALSELLRRQQVDLVDLWRGRQQALGVGHQRLGDLALQVRLASGVIVEGVENAERR